MPDIDIDFVNREEVLKLFDHTAASRLEDDQLIKHNTGIYLHEVPVDPITGLSAIEYNRAEELGFFKIDFLNVGIYNGVRNEDHLVSLMNKEPLWELLEDSEFVKLLFHVNGHADILKKMKPRSIEQLSAILAMIRPAKRHLIGQSWDKVLTEVWKKPNTEEYYFKKSHAVAYAAAIVVQMNLICEKISYEYS
jgi:DNA polymerase III alpha subunit